jgi:hypothetical protein
MPSWQGQQNRRTFLRNSTRRFHAYPCQLGNVNTITELLGAGPRTNLTWERQHNHRTSQSRSTHNSAAYRQATSATPAQSRSSSESEYACVRCHRVEVEVSNGAIRWKKKNPPGGKRSVFQRTGGEFQGVGKV